MSRLTLPVALAALALLPGAAHAAKLPPEMIYDVRVEASMVEKWDFSEYSEYECDDGMCIRDQKGAGTATINLATKVWRLHVTGGKGKRAPYVDVGNAGGLPFKGEYVRNGSDTVDYRGVWEGSNPDEASVTTGCGRQPMKTDVGFAFPERNKIHLTALIDDVRECPMGPPHNLEWQDNATPTLWDVVVPVQQSKFARTKQFRVRGERTWTGTVNPVNRTTPGDMFVRGGGQTTTWKWEATFRKVGKRKRRR
jgi:hypothetical protein